MSAPEYGPCPTCGRDHYGPCEPASEERVAVRDLPTRCSQCGCRIDHGDRYRVIGWAGGFDYEHADCSKTSFIDHLKGKP